MTNRIKCGRCGRTYPYSFTSDGDEFIDDCPRCGGVPWEGNGIYIGPPMNARNEKVYDQQEDQPSDQEPAERP